MFGWALFSENDTVSGPRRETSPQENLRLLSPPSLCSWVSASPVSPSVWLPRDEGCFSHLYASSETLQCLNSSKPIPFSFLLFCIAGCNGMPTLVHFHRPPNRTSKDLLCLTPFITRADASNFFIHQKTSSLSYGLVYTFYFANALN